MEPQTLLEKARQHFADFERTNRHHSLNRALAYATDVIDEYEGTKFADLAARLIRTYRTPWLSKARESIEKMDSMETLDQHRDICDIFLEYGPFEEGEEEELTQLSYALNEAIVLAKVKEYKVIDKHGKVRETYQAPEEFSTKAARDQLIKLYIETTDCENTDEALARIYSDARRRFHADMLKAFRRQDDIIEKLVDQTNQDPELKAALLKELGLA